MSYSNQLNLNELWCRGINDRPVVTGRNGQMTTRRELFSAAGSLSSKISGKKVAIFCKSSKLETIALLAAFKTAAAIILPSTNQPEALNEIKTEFDVLLTDEATVLDIETIIVGEDRDYTFDKSDEILIDPNLKISFFTSGSTGKPKEIYKRFYQLDNEVRAWEKMYSSEFGSAEVHSMVSHQHVYGLLFRLLWPLCAGRPFRDETATNWDEISTATKDGNPFILVSSPTHLSRLTAFEDSAISVTPLITFSSGGSIPDEFASQAAGHLTRPVLEIYGSTETGGIAKRHNTGQNDIWVPLPNVELSQNEKGCLQLKSQFLENSDELFETEDLVSFTQNGSFTLLGRADRIVKVEGKRVSLPRIEELLRKHKFVQDVTTKMIGEERPQLAAVIELSQLGVSYLTENGSFRTGRFLRKYLGQFDDAVTGPRRWLFVDLMPRNPQGKIVTREIDDLFNSKDKADSPERQKFERTEFREITRNVSEDKAEIILTAPADLDYFKGHFTDNPLLPGVVQVHWATQVSSEIFSLKTQPKKIEKLKFKTFIFPDTKVGLFLERKSDRRISFLFQSKNALGEVIDHSSGILNFEEDM